MIVCIYPSLSLILSLLQFRAVLTCVQAAYGVIFFFLFTMVVHAIYTCLLFLAEKKLCYFTRIILRDRILLRSRLVQGYSIFMTTIASCVCVCTCCSSYTLSFLFLLEGCAMAK